MRESWFTDGGYRSLRCDYYPWAARFDMTDEAGTPSAVLEVYSEWLGENGCMRASAVNITNMERMRPIMESLAKVKGVPVEDRERLLSKIRISALRFFQPQSNRLRP